MGFLESVAVAVVPASLGAFFTLWLKEHPKFRAVGTAVFGLLSAATLLAIVLSIGYGSGRSDQWRADSAVVSEARDKLSKAQLSAMEGKFDQREEMKEIVNAFPIGLPFPPSFATPIPLWAWISAGLLLIELMVLLTVRFSTHRIATGNKSDGETGVSDVEE